MKIFVISELYWNHQCGAADWGYYATHVVAAFTSYDAAEKYILDQSSEHTKLEWSKGEGGWWKNNSIVLKIEEVIVQ